MQNLEKFKFTSHNVQYLTILKFINLNYRVALSFLAYYKSTRPLQFFHK